MRDTAAVNYLITDDDSDDRDFIAEALLKQGVKGTIKSFGDGKALIEYIEKNPKSGSIILLDLNMPVLNGYETLRKIKENNIRENNTIIILTSSVKAEDEAVCRDLGCDAFFRKPISMSDYAALAKKIIATAATGS